VFFGDSSKLKNSVAESGIYDKFVTSIIEENIKQQTSNSNSIPLDDPRVQEIIYSVFNPRVLQTSAELVIDGAYTWLEVEDVELSFIIDFTQQREQLIDGLSSYSATRLEGLPPCSSQDLQTPNVFKLQCQPPGFYEELVKKQVSSDLTNSDFLKDAVLTEKNLPSAVDGATIDQKYSFAPLAYQVLKNSIWIFGILFVVATIIYIAIRKPTRKGVKAYGKDILANGLLLLIFTVFYSVVVPRLMSSYSLQANTGANAINDSFKYFTNRLDGIIINIAIQIVAVGILILAIEKISRTSSIYGALAKKAGITTSIKPAKKLDKKETLAKPPVQTSETAKKSKFKKQKSSKFRKMGL